MCKIDSQWEAAVQHRELSSVFQWGGVGGGVGGGREDQEAGDICVHTADSHCCTVEANTTL